MLASSRQRLLEMLPEDAVVLDLGGWADPFERADWVIDLMPWDTRGLYARQGWAPSRTSPERFTRESWVQRDLCSHEPFPFADGEIDFAVCSHTLEDLRDPLWVCAELSRVARAGYIEVPSRLEEQSWGVNGEFVGWSHHHWLIDLDLDMSVFTFKIHAIHSRPDWFFPPDFWRGLRPEERVQTLWWQGAIPCRERVLLDDEEADRHIGGLVREELARRGLYGAREPRNRAGVLRAWAGSFGRISRRAGRETGR